MLEIFKVIGLSIDITFFYSDFSFRVAIAQDTVFPRFAKLD